MANIEGEVNIAPYLNPAHWDGHTLGVGEVDNDLQEGYKFGESRYAREVIDTRVRSNSVVPLDTFQQGQTFNPTGYEPGTVVLFRRESLSGPSIEEDYDIDELVEQELPIRSAETSPSFGPHTSDIAADDGKRQYLSIIRWGVVPRTRQPNLLLSTPASRVFERGIGAHALYPFLGMHAPIVTGETRHYPRRSRVEEHLERVNILHVIAYGSPQKQKSRFFGLLGKPALGNNH